MWPFGKKKIQPVGQPNLPVLPFNSGESFFEMQCKFGHTEIIPKRGIVALVLSISRREKDGIQAGLIKVASSDGGFQVFAETPSSKGDEIKDGDVVIWVPITLDPELGAMSKLVNLNDERSGWVGLIMAKVAPVIDPNSPNFKVLDKFH